MVLANGSRSRCSYLYVVRAAQCGQDFLGFRLRGDGVFGCQLDGQVKKSCGQRLQSFVKILAWSGLGKIVLTSRDVQLSERCAAISSEPANQLTFPPPMQEPDGRVT